MSRTETIWRAVSFDTRRALGQKHIKYGLARGYAYLVRAKLIAREKEDRELTEAYQELITTAVKYDTTGGLRA